jgi:acetoacetyl-CoA reductase
VRLSATGIQSKYFLNIYPGIRKTGMSVQKVAVVTGGTDELGEAICRKLSTAGYRVLPTYSPGYDNAQLWLESQASAGFIFSAYMIDVSKHASCAKGVGKMLSDVGRIDVLVNNAGITRNASFEKMTAENWRLVLRGNLDSVFNMTSHAVNNMLERQWGRIINISSIEARSGTCGPTNDAAAKAGVHGFSKSLALELACKGITVNTVSPGYLRTEAVRRMPQQALKTEILPQIPVGRLGEPGEVAGLVAYLSSDEAAFVTGNDIAVNGGQYMY